MATYSDVIQGLELLASRDNKGLDTHGVCAAHDEIWAGSTPPEEFGEIQRQALDAWGWEWVEDIGSWRRYV